MLRIYLLLLLHYVTVTTNAFNATDTTNNVIFWVSEPVLPGENAVIAIASKPVSNNDKTPLEVYGRQVDPSSSASSSSTASFTALKVQGDTGYGITATIPSNYKIGEFELQIKRGNVTGPIYRANVPRPWFAFGNQGDYSTPGGTIRVIGDGISLPSTDSTPSFLLGDHEYLTTPKWNKQYPNKNIPPIPQLYLQRIQDSSSADTTAQTDNPVINPAIQLSGENMTRSHAAFQLPNDLPYGIYTVSISNSESGTIVPLCTFQTPSIPCVSTMNITAPPFTTTTFPNKSKQMFIVNAEQPGYGRNATTAIQKALSAAKENGGGIIYFPRGQYFHHGPILMCEGCILQGERTDLVSIYFFEQNQTTAPNAYITQENENTTSFGLEDLSIYVTSFANNIIRFQPSSKNCYMRKIRLRYNSYFALEPITGKSSRGRNTSWPHSQGTAVMLAGKNIQVEHCDIYSSGDVVSTLYNGMPGGSYFHIANNRFWNGGTTHWGIEWKQCIYENNIATGVSVTAMGSNYPQYDHNDGNPHVQNIYHFNNSQNMIWGNDREMMTSDAGGGVYWGAVVPQETMLSSYPAGTSSSSNPLTAITLVDWVGGVQPGGAMCVLQGSNTGQCRRVVTSGTPESNYTRGWSINIPFAIPLDSSSRIAIMPYQGKIAFNRNRYSDGGAVQFYSTATNCQAHENVFERTGGLIAWGRMGSFAPPHYMWGPNLRNVFYDNVVKEGNHVYNYATTGDGSPYHAGGSKTIEPWSFGSLSNDQGPPWETLPVNPEYRLKCTNIGNSSTGNCFKGALNRFIVFRGNRVLSNGGIVVRGTSANVLVEGSVVELSDVGMHTNDTTTMGGIVMEGNVQPKNVPSNYNPYQIK